MFTHGFSNLFCFYQWLFHLTLPDPQYHTYFATKLEELSSRIADTIPVSSVEQFDDDHFAQHGRVYLALFQIRRCIDWQSHHSLYGHEERLRFTVLTETLDKIMKNYRFVPFSQLEYACKKAAELKPLFENA
jgi:hypothetical protein